MRERQRASSRAAATPIITRPLATTAGTVPIKEATGSGLERTELVRRADEHPVDRAHPSLQVRAAWITATAVWRMLTLIMSTKPGEAW